MSFAFTEIGELLTAGLEQPARAKLLELLEHNRGNVAHAALRAGVHVSTVKRWIVRLEVQSQLERIRARTKPRTMREETRTKLEEQRREQRRLTALQRALKRLGAERVAERTRISLPEVRRWLRGHSVALEVTWRLERLAAEVLERRRKQIRAWPSYGKPR